MEAERNLVGEGLGGPCTGAGRGGRGAVTLQNLVAGRELRGGMCVLD